ncbi:MAG: hypothetical protein OEW08_15525 [Gammaproteobacteria bacterium]|nr:hypothetical protein [Gammaproteobacteria bacterium]
MSLKPKRPGLAVAALCIGVIALPVAGFVHWMLGVVLMAAPIFMIYAAG